MDPINGQSIRGCHILFDFNHIWTIFGAHFIDAFEHVLIAQSNYSFANYNLIKIKLIYFNKY